MNGRRRKYFLAGMGLRLKPVLLVAWVLVCNEIRHDHAMLSHTADKLSSVRWPWCNHRSYMCHCGVTNLNIYGTASAHGLRYIGGAMEHRSALSFVDDVAPRRQTIMHLYPYLHWSARLPNIRRSRTHHDLSLSPLNQSVALIQKTTALRPAQV